MTWNKETYRSISSRIEEAKIELNSSRKGIHCFLSESEEKEELYSTIYKTKSNFGLKESLFEEVIERFLETTRIPNFVSRSSNINLLERVLGRRGYEIIHGIISPYKIRRSIL